MRGRKCVYIQTCMSVLVCLCVQFSDQGPMAVSKHLLWRVSLYAEVTGWSLLPLIAPNPGISICISFQSNLFTLSMVNTARCWCVSGGVSVQAQLQRRPRLVHVVNSHCNPEIRWVAWRATGGIKFMLDLATLIQLDPSVWDTARPAFLSIQIDLSVRADS